MSKTAIAIVLAVWAVGCGGKKKDAEPVTKGSAGAPPPITGEVGAGSAEPGMGSGMEGSAALHVPATDAERAQAFEACWALWSAARFDAFASCYALDAKSEAPGGGEPAATSRAAILEQVKTEHAQIPDEKAQLGLELVSGQTVIAVVQVSGTGAGKPYGVLAGVITDMNDRGLITHEQTFLDAGTIEAQVTGKAGARAVATGTPVHELVIAKNDDQEKANHEVFRKLEDAFDKHDPAAYGALLGDTVTWSETVEGKDADKKGLLAGVQQLWRDVPDVHVDVARSWAVGAYVAAEEKLVGTPRTGKAFEAPALMILELHGGKVAAGWLFVQSKAIEP